MHSGRGGSIDLRPMRGEDLDQILEMEKDLFVEPWTLPIFLREVRDTKRSWSVVAEEDARIVCYAIAWVVNREFHIANLAVLRENQSRGIGGQLLDLTLEEGLRRGCRLATLEVRCSNRQAIRLYESRNFRGIALRKGYYAEDGEDALVMIRDLGGREGENGGVV